MFRWKKWRKVSTCKSLLFTFFILSIGKKNHFTIKKYSFSLASYLTYSSLSLSSFNFLHIWSMNISSLFARLTKAINKAYSNYWILQNINHKIIVNIWINVPFNLNPSCFNQSTSSSSCFNSLENCLCIHF